MSHDTETTFDQSVKVTAWIPLGSLSECFQSIRNGGGEVLAIDVPLKGL